MVTKAIAKYLVQTSYIYPSWVLVVIVLKIKLNFHSSKPDYGLDLMEACASEQNKSIMDWLLYSKPFPDKYHSDISRIIEGRKCSLPSSSKKDQVDMVRNCEVTGNYFISQCKIWSKRSGESWQLAMEDAANTTKEIIDALGPLALEDNCKLPGLDKLQDLGIFDPSDFIQQS